MYEISRLSKLIWNQNEERKKIVDMKRKINLSRLITPLISFFFLLYPIMINVRLHEIMCLIIPPSPPPH